jgi:hypothetical protein
MMLLRKYSVLGLAFLLPIGVLQAYARVFETTTDNAPESRQSLPSGPNKRVEKPQKTVTKKTYLAYQHMICGSTALRRLDVDDYTYSLFNNQAIQNIAEKAINDISFDYGFSYHYRPDPTYSLGIAFDRLQVNQCTLDLRYSSLDSVPPDPLTLPVIASDLTDGSDPYAVANYYSPATFGNRGYAYEGVVRAYILPKWAIDPFFQATVGYTHNRGSVERADGSSYTYASDQLWTWSIGSGWSYPISPSMRIETLMMIRNQDKMQFGDRISAPSQNAQYNFTAYTARYYSADLKISLCQTW